MSIILATVAVVAAALAYPVAAAAQAVAPQTAAQEKPAQPKPAAKSSTVTMTGCVSGKPDASGRYTFAETDGVGRYQLSGRRLARFAGQRVEIVGGSPGGGGLAVRGGLVGPMGGARGVAIDPAQESVRRQPGGGGAGIGPAYPEFRVSRVKTVAGVCEEAD
jgi:hypothetical protein